MRLYIVPGAPTFFYQQGNHNSCILQSSASELHYMGDGYASEYIIRCKQKYLLVIQNKCQMQFFRDILMRYHKEKMKKLPNHCIEEWNISTPYDMFWNPYTYPNVCLLLDTCHRTDHCITVCDKWIFDSNFEVYFPLTHYFLNYSCRGNDTDQIKYFAVFHAIISVPPEVIQRRLNMK